MRTGLIGAAVLLVGAAGVVLLWRWAPGEVPALAGEGESEASAVAVETVTVETRDMRELASFAGSLEPSSQVEIAARVGGLLESLAVDIGDTVTRGQVVARVDDDEAQLSLAEARAELAVARAQLSEAEAALANARRGLERTQRLSRQGVASAAALDSARAEADAQAAQVELSRAQIEQRQAAVRGAQVRQSYTLVRALWEGEDENRVVAERHADQGTLVAANQRLLTVISENPVIAVVYSTESAYPRLRIGQTATIETVSRGNRDFTGNIARIAPVFDASSRQARIEIELSNADGELIPGAFAVAKVELGREEDATAVPTDALVERDGGPGVFLVEGDQARFIAVRPGIEEAGWVAIEPDLVGEVVTLGQHLLEDGFDVAVANPEDEAGGT